MSKQKPVQIAASILSADFSRLGEEVRLAETGGADVIHVDVMDGHFVPNITVGPLVVQAVRRVTGLPIFTHLMIESPERYIPVFIEAGASCVTVHQETCPHLHRTVQQIKELGAKAGVAINPATPVALLEEIVPYADLVLVMTVNPGFGGQEFIEGMLDKVRRVRELLDARASEAYLEVDGGVNPITAPRLVAAGADMLVAGAAIFAAPEGVVAAIAAIRETASRAR